MRDILFRGKDSLGNWRFGSLVYKSRESRWKDNYYANRGMDGHVINRGHYYIIDSSGDGYWVALNTIGQCTGLIGKNGKKIFEGDIVEDIQIRKRYVVEYQFNAFVLADIDKSVFKLSDFYFCKVIGNVYDNPELLSPGVE